MVQDIMSKKVYTVSPNESILNVTRIMKEHNVGVVPVVEDSNKVMGVITDRDIVLSIADFNFDMVNTEALKLMSDKVYSVRPGADVKDAIALMRKQQIRRLPVIEDDMLVGIISIGDIAVSKEFKAEIAEAICEISMNK